MLPSAATQRPALVAAAFLLACLCPTTLAQDNFCGTIDQRSAIVNDKLYFTSGNYSFDDGRVHRLEPFIYSLDLSKPIDVTGVVTNSSLNPIRLPDSALEGQEGPRFGGYGGALFHDNSTLYPYAAMAGSVSRTDELWRYNTAEQKWTQTKIEGDPLAFPNNYGGVSASDPTTSRSFYTGGYEINFKGEKQGVVRFDQSNSLQPKWDFLSTDRVQRAPGVLKGGMVYIPKGKAGMLVAFGGWDVTNGDEPLLKRMLNQISVFDIHANQWYVVDADAEADAEVPEWRYEFCAVASAAPDGSSFQITMYGGLNFDTGKRFSEVYTLSIPSFTWINTTPLPSNDPELKQAPDSGRLRHTCEIFRGRQMIVVGGDTEDPKCDKNFPPFKVFDTAKMEWRQQFDPNLGDYEVPEMVVKTIGGNAFGNATRREPRNGWDPALSASFAENPELTTLPPNATEPATSTPSPNRTPAIVGGVLGSVFALALIAFSVWFFLRRRHQRAQRGIRLPSPYLSPPATSHAGFPSHSRSGFPFPGSSGHAGPEPLSPSAEISARSGTTTRVGSLNSPRSGRGPYARAMLTERQLPPLPPEPAELEQPALRAELPGHEMKGGGRAVGVSKAYN